MNGLPYYKAYPRDFIEGTIGMPFEIKCAYRVVLDLIYMQGGKLPDDPRYISGHLGCSIRKWKSIRADLIERGKLVVVGDALTNDRADKELETLAKLQQNQREKAAKPRKNNILQQPRQSQPEPEPDKNKGAYAPSVRARRFQEFWDAFPHRGGAKKGRSDCEKKYRAIVASGVDEETLISAASRYRNDGQVLRGYGKGPMPWLNQKGWEDDIEPSDAHNPRHTGRSGPHDSLVAGFAQFADRVGGAGGGDCGGGETSFHASNGEVDRWPDCHASQPVLRVIGSN